MFETIIYIIIGLSGFIPFIILAKLGVFKREKNMELKFQKMKKLLKKIYHITEVLTLMKIFLVYII